VVKVFFDSRLGWSNRLHIIEFAIGLHRGNYSLQNPMKPVCKPNPRRRMYLPIYLYYMVIIIIICVCVFENSLAPGQYSTHVQLHFIVVAFRRKNGKILAYIYRCCRVYAVLAHSPKVQDIAGTFTSYYIVFILLILAGGIS